MIFIYFIIYIFTINNYFSLKNMKTVKFKKL